jgi:hypothetical protein
MIMYICNKVPMLEAVIKSGKAPSSVEDFLRINASHKQNAMHCDLEELANNGAQVSKHLHASNKDGIILQASKKSEAMML